MIQDLGSITLAAALPTFDIALIEFLRVLASEIAAVQGEAAALAGDLIALQGDVAALFADLANPAGVLESMLEQVARGPATYVEGVQAAIASLAAGLTLVGLTQALTAGPAIFMQSLNAAISEVTAKVAAIQAKIAAVQARILSLAARVAALAARVEALLATQAVVVGWRAGLSASIALYRFDGTVNNLGSELDAVVGGLPADLAEAVVLVARAPSAIAALGSLFA